ncbi:MAG: bifunctional 5,10-methylenetetrahydrofolate dehydrogenase/5,10-methenyltetrahydrofolate cyclohydrolase [Egibacteraceae bacterium]
MAAHIIDGRELAAELKRHLGAQVRRLSEQGTRPGLATVIAGDDYPSVAYERRVRRLAEELGCHYVCAALSSDVSEADVIAEVGKLDADPRVHGILVLRPLPADVAEAAVYRALDPLKDIEAVHPVNAGLLALGRPRYVPSTPASVFHMLDRYLSSTSDDPAAVYARSNLVVVGRSSNVGKPAMLLAQARNATVVSCDVHSSRAGLLVGHTRAADILVVAAGVPELIGAEHVKEGAVVIDVGINPVSQEGTGKVRLVGDVDFNAVAEKAAAISPVPGGVGPITDVWLLRNTVWAARLAASVQAAQPSWEGLSVPGDLGAAGLVAAPASSSA